MEAVGEPQNVNLEFKISHDKILELGTENLYFDSEECQVLDIENCQNLAEAQIAMATTCLESFPNIFVIILEVLSLKNEELETFLNFLLKKIPKNREMFLQINLIDLSEWQVHHKAKNVEKFIKLDLSSDVDLFIKRFKLNKKLEAKNFFEILRFLNYSLVDVNFNQILDFLSINDKFLLIKNAIESKNGLLVKLLILFVTELSEDLLSEAHKSKNIEILILILNNFTLNDVSEEQVRKILDHELRDEFLLKIAGENHFKILQILLKYPQTFYEFLNFKTWCQAKNKAFDRNFHKFNNALQAAEIKLYARNSNGFFGESSSSKRPHNIPSYNDIIELHKSITKGDLNEVKNFVKIFPEFKICVYRAKCALQRSVEAKKYEIYAFLCSKNFVVFNGDEFQELIDELNDDELKKVQEENLKVLKSNPDDFINILATKIKLFAGGVNLSFAEIREMLEKLKEREENREVMRIASQANFTIAFDFVNSSVKIMVPSKDETVLGLTQSYRKLVYVGKNEGKMHRYGTFAHELMHFVLRLIYENNALPYCKKDDARKIKWVEIVQELKDKCNDMDMDDIIRRVFTAYSDQDTEGEEEDEALVVTRVEKKEAAVRVNHLLAFYHDNDAKIKELVRLHPELFSFMRDKVVADLKIPNVYRMIKLNNDFGLLGSIEKSPLQVKTTNNELLSQINDIKLILCSNVPQLMLSKILNEIKDLPGNKLNLKARNFFVNFEKLENFKSEFEDLIEKMRKEVESDSNLICRVVVDLHKTLLKPELKDLHKEIKKSIKNLQRQQKENFEFLCELKFQLIFVVSSLSDLPTDFIPQDHNFEQQITHNINWQHLTKKTKNNLLKKSIKFQEKLILLREIISDAETSITPEILTILCSESEIQVNCKTKVEKVKKFIERTVQVKKSAREGGEFEDFSLENFITAQSEQILVISDVAGSGKTTLLRKIHEIIMKSFPQHFIIFISLLKYVEELKEGVGDSFTEFIAKVLNFDPLERQIFMQKYSKGEVKILFDAFDEISPNCKQNTTKLFQLFDKNSKNQVFITTRTHLEHHLERDLKVLANSIKILTAEEQIKFLEESWDNSDRVLVKKCAEALVRKIFDIISWRFSVIGVPLIVRGLAQAYKDKIDENFEHEIQYLDILSVYEKIIDTFFVILSSRFPQKLGENQKKTMSLRQVHQFRAICLFFSEDFANSLGLNHDKDEWPSEEIARCGLIKYDKDGKFHFIHQTYAEFFIAGFIFHLLKNVKKLPIQLDFIFLVLTERNFYVTRMFLDSMLNRVEKVQDLKCFNSSHEICEKVKINKKNFLDFCMHEKLFHVFEFVALAVKKSDVDLFKEVIEYRNDRTATILMKILPHATNLPKFKKFLDEILSFYSENVFGDFLLKTDGRGDTILHYFARKCMSKKVIECFWNKIEVFFVDEVKLRGFLFVKKGDFKRSALLLSIMHQNENSFFFLFEEVYCKFFNVKEIAYVTDETYKDGQNILHNLAEFGSVSMLKIALEKLKKEFSPEEFRDFVKIKSKKGKNILHYAAQNENENSVEFLVSFIANEFGIEGVIKMLSELDDYKQLPFLYAVQFNNLKHFEFFFSLYKQNFSSEQIFEFLHAKNYDGDNFLLSAASFSRYKDVFGFAWTKIESLIEDEDKLKQLLLTKNNEERNALLQSIIYRNEHIFCFLFEEVYCKHFSIKEFAHETDKDGASLLHYLAIHGSVLMLKFALEKLKIKFLPEEFQNFVKLRSKDGRNLLHFAAINSNEDSVEYLVNIIENKVGSEDFKKMLSELDDSKHLSLHYSANFKNLNDFKFFFAFYEKNFRPEQIYKFLYAKDVNGSNFLYRTAVYSNSSDIFKFAWRKIESLIEDKEKLKQLLLAKGHESGNTSLRKEENLERNVLLLSIVLNDEHIFYFLFKEVYCKFFNVKEFAYETDDDGKNLLHYLARYGSVSTLKFALEKLNTEFSAEEFQNFVKLRSKDGRNLLHFTALNSNKELVEFVVNFIENKVSNEEVKKMLSELDNHKSLPLHYAVRSFILIFFKNFYSLYEKNFSQKKICEFLDEKDVSGNNFLLYAASYSKSKDVVEFAWTKIKSFIVDKEKLKQLLLMKGGNLEGNALLNSTANRNENIFCFLFEQVYCKVFSIKEFAHETDKDGASLLHYLAIHGSVLMLKFVSEKLKTAFSLQEFQNFVKLRFKDGGNLLHFAALNSNKESVEYLVNFIEDEVGSEEVKKMLSEPDNSKQLPLHYAVTSWNSQVFDFFFSLCEKNFNLDELKAFLTSINDENENIFTLMLKRNLTLLKPEHSEWKKILDEYREANIDIRTDSDVNE